MKLVKNARHAWRWFSVQSMVVAGALQGAWLAIPADLKTHVPGWLATALTMGILALGVIGRLVDQEDGDA
jgi:hypothetical protein